MKELLAIIQAMERARKALSMQGEYRPQVLLVELTDILQNDEVTCPLEKVQASLGSPPIVPDAAPLEKEQIIAPPF